MMHPKIKRTPDVVLKISKCIKKENPMTQRSIASMVGTSPATVNKVIKKDLDFKVVKKRKVHTLTENHRQNRRTNCRIIYERYLAADRWKYFVTYDEAWIYLSNCDKKEAFIM